MDYMSRALDKAREALGISSPNPPVGAVLVKDGLIVGEGHTMPPGESHAEIIALRQAGSKSRGATLYTTLEPCCHYGRTPPCTREIINAGVSAISIGLIDPNPLVKGMGMAELEEAGLETRLGECEVEVSEICESYIKFVSTGLPFVVAKFAMSLDGKIATRNGESKWITSDNSRMYGSRLRKESDAVVVGIGTVLADNPRLTVRDKAGNTLSRQPYRIILDSKARMSASSDLFGDRGPIMVITAGSLDQDRVSALELAGAEVLRTIGRNDQVDLNELLKLLAGRGITKILVEGGSTVLGSLFDLGLVDKVIAFVAPVILGGENAVSPVGGNGISFMKDALRLQRSNMDVIDGDVIITGYKR